jgi:dihydroorotase
LRLEKGTLRVGADADVTVIDPEQEWMFERETSASKSYNSPFYGWQLKGRARTTIVGGRIVWREQGRSVNVQPTEA